MKKQRAGVARPFKTPAFSGKVANSVLSSLWAEVKRIFTLKEISLPREYFPG
jgi:hypothetical protein